MMEENLRRALLLSRGDWTTFVTRPLSAGLLIAAALMIVVVLLPSISKKREVAFVEEESRRLHGMLRRVRAVRRASNDDTSESMPSFDWSAGYPSRAFRSSAATSSPRRIRSAAQAGLRMLQKGGNAVDAAIAAAAAMTILEPVSNGLGSDAFCILWDGKRAAWPNASGRAPPAWTPEYFARKYGADAKTPPQRGWDTVDGARRRRGWVALSERFGKLPFADLLAPAIEIAERGYAVPVVVQQKWAARGAAAARRSRASPRPSCRAAARRTSASSFAFAAAARTLARDRADERRGLLPRRDRRGRSRACAGARRRDDGGRPRRATQPEWVEPIGHRLRRPHAARDPAERAGHRGADRARHPARTSTSPALPVDGVDSQHLQIEAMKLAFADTYRYVAEPARDGGDARADARRALSAERAQPDRHEARAGLRGRQPASRAARST